MYPVLFRVGEFEVSSFGVMVAIGALVGLWLFRRELDRSGLAADGVDAALVGVIGGLIGAKLLYVAEHLGEEPVSGLLFARAGLSWYGGFAGGLGAGLLTLTVKHLPVVPLLAAATPALALGHAIGRVGCLLVGDGGLSAHRRRDDLHGRPRPADTASRNRDQVNGALQR